MRGEREGRGRRDRRGEREGKGEGRREREKMGRGREGGGREKGGYQGGGGGVVQVYASSDHYYSVHTMQQYKIYGHVL